jgi:hypothetical protein
MPKRPQSALRSYRPAPVRTERAKRNVSPKSCNFLQLINPILSRTHTIQPPHTEFSVATRLLVHRHTQFHGSMSPCTHTYTYNPPVHSELVMGKKTRTNNTSRSGPDIRIRIHKPVIHAQYPYTHAYTLKMQLQELTLALTQQHTQTHKATHKHTHTHTHSQTHTRSTHTHTHTHIHTHNTQIAQAHSKHA